MDSWSVDEATDFRGLKEEPEFNSSTLSTAKCYMNLGGPKNLCIQKSRRDSAMLEGLTEMHVIIVRCMVFSALHPE